MFMPRFVTLFVLLVTASARAAAADGDAPAEWWSLRPLVRPAVPGGGGNPIDAFIRAKLRDKGLAMAPEADRRTLIRRVTFDLTGLPPTPAEVAAFEADRSPGAYERLIDRFSPARATASGGRGTGWTRFTSPRRTAPSTT
jgi:hypothetical protein